MLIESLKGLFDSDWDDKFPELVIMSTWDVNGHYDNRVCGHLYEVIEYFWLLKDHFYAYFIFPENIDLDEVLKKYNFTDTEKDLIKSKAIGRPKNGIVNTKQGSGLVLIVDGNLGNFNGTIRGIPVQFSCGKDGLYPSATKPEHFYLSKQDWYLLHDHRTSTITDFLYNKEETPGTTEATETKSTFIPLIPEAIYSYTKKVLLTSLNDAPKTIEVMRRRPTKDCKVLLYLTKNCKFLTPEQISDILVRNYVDSITDVLIVTDYSIDITLINHPNSRIEIVDIEQGPVDLFNLDWTHYIYTPVERQWDCSNRLIVECMYHGRAFHIDSGLGYKDRALEVRLNDVIYTRRLFEQYGKHSPSLNYNHPFTNIINLAKDDNIIDILFHIYKTELIKRGFEDLGNYFNRNIRHELVTVSKLDFEWAPLWELKCPK